MSQRIVLVGHCGVDGPRIKTQVESIIGGAQVSMANDPAELERAAEGADLLMFNRELGVGFNDTEGVEAMKELRKKHPDVKMMLISDYPDAQAQAQAAGAVKGFGKADLGSPKVETAVKNALK